MKSPIPCLLLACVLLTSCLENNQNLNQEGEDIFAAVQIDAFPTTLALRDTTYVPVYSDIYSETKEIRFNLTATLSLRNTSLKHKLFVSAVDYYDSSGERIRQYLNKPIVLKPMQSVEYVIEEKDTSGGTGANFIIIWGAESPSVNPVFEGIMISTDGQQGISFSSRGVSISHK